jgi:hypothetical protein
LGFHAAALTFLNQPVVVAIIFQAWHKCGHHPPKTEEAICNFSTVAGTKGIS